ncbi:hypothetical protein F5X99DRAFT_342979 [Biscogniauxia marginata]|nr:hypothetical protein F5X99DRAFT_342979 [Biscogniauxia marginata]
MVSRKFCVIIAGGGPTGLTLAHSLTKAGIEFVVLERRPTIVEDVGASLVISPESLRVYSQLGLLDRLYKIGAVLKGINTVTQDGTPYNKSLALSLLKDTAGCLSFIFHRAHLVEVLYDSLDDTAKSRVFTNKKVVDITSGDNGARVRCADGTVYDGTIVVGADGAHSRVRKSMRTLALEESPTAEINPNQPWQYEYRMTWFTFPHGPNIECDVSIEAHGTDSSAQFMSGNNQSYMFVYERLTEPASERVFYTAEDVDEFAEKLGHLTLKPGFTVKDAYALKYHAGMVNLGEGMLEHWSWKRLVLVGDAAHMLTPNVGRGLNNGIQDAVALTNELRRLFASDEDHPVTTTEPSLEALGEVFARYQSARQEVFLSDLSFSGTATRLCAWKSWSFWFIDRWIFPMVPAWFETWFFSWLYCAPISRGLALDFLKGEEPFSGNLLWAHPILKS